MALRPIRRKADRNLWPPQKDRQSIQELCEKCSDNARLVDPSETPTSLASPRSSSFSNKWFVPENSSPAPPGARLAFLFRW